MMRLLFLMMSTLSIVFVAPAWATSKPGDLVAMETEIDLGSSIFVKEHVSPHLQFKADATEAMGFSMRYTMAQDHDFQSYVGVGMHYTAPYVESVASTHSDLAGDGDFGTAFKVGLSYKF